MKQLVLLLLISFGLIGASYADAVCKDGWISKSSGSGTCSSHGGVKKWLNKIESSDKHENRYSPDNGVIGKCKGSYKQREICRKRSFQIRREMDLSRQKYLEYERDDRTIEQRLEDLISNRKSTKDYRSDAEKAIAELLKDL